MYMVGYTRQKHKPRILKAYQNFKLEPVRNGKLFHGSQHSSNPWLLLVYINIFRKCANLF